MTAARRDVLSLPPVPRTDGEASSASATLPGARIGLAPSDVRVLPVGSMQHGDHVCAAFASLAEREELLIDFVRGGLESGDQVLCFTHRHDASSVLALLHDALEVDGPLVRGQLQVLDIAEAMLSRDSFDAQRALDALAATVERAIAAGYGGIRFAGEASWASPQLQRCARLEEWEWMLTDFFSKRPAAGFCQYDRESFDEPRLKRLIDLHPSVARSPVVSKGGLLRIAETSRGAAELRLAGEIDLSNRELLADALARVAAAGGDIHLDARRLEFIDLTGFAELVRTALEIAPDRRLLVHHPPPCLRRLLECVPGYRDLIHV
jgi:anti-anti-sigma factor